MSEINQTIQCLYTDFFLGYILKNAGNKNNGVRIGIRNHNDAIMVVRILRPV